MKGNGIFLLLVLSACIETADEPGPDCEGDSCDNSAAVQLDANALFDMLQSAAPFADGSPQATAILAVVNAPQTTDACKGSSDCLGGGGHIGGALCTQLSSSIQNCAAGRTLQAARKSGLVFESIDEVWIAATIGGGKSGAAVAFQGLLTYAMNHGFGP